VRHSSIIIIIMIRRRRIRIIIRIIIRIMIIIIHGSNVGAPAVAKPAPVRRGRAQFAWAYPCAMAGTMMGERRRIQKRNSLTLAATQRCPREAMLGGRETMLRGISYRVDIIGDITPAGIPCQEGTTRTRGV
jgi:hypothetical protein